MNENDLNQLTDRLLQGLDFADLAHAQAQRHSRERDALIGDLLVLADGIQDLADHCRSLGDGAPGLCRTVGLIERQLMKLLARQGVEPMGATGGRLDLMRHEVAQVQAAASVPADTVLAEVCRGYVQGERILRRAKVVIASDESGVTSTRHEGNQS